MKKIFLVLSFIFVFLSNFVINNCKAYDINDNTFQIDYTIHNGYTSSTAEGDLYWLPGNDSDSRCIILQNEEFNEKMCGYSDSTWTYSKFICLFRYKGGFGADGVTGNDILKNGSPIISSEWFQEKFGSNISNIECIAIATDYVYNYGEGYIMHANIDDYKVNGISTQSVQYVNTIEDLKKYLLDGDNSVVKEGDPLNPPVIEDNTLPVPQSLTCDLHNSYNASNPFIEGSWKNPSNASWEAIKNDVRIHIQYKPKFQFYKRFISVKDGQRSAHQYIELGTEHNENKNHWVNAFPNTPTLKDNYIKYETLQQDMQDVARMVGAGEEFYPGGATLLNGTSWRVRYEMPDGRVSFWAVYGVNSIGDIKSSDTVSFQDNEDNAVSADAVDYQNSWQTDPNNYNPDTINNSLLSRLRQALNDLQSLPSDMNTVANEGSSFANFLRKVWQKFPEIYIIFIGGLIIAIILRILGR